MSKFRCPVCDKRYEEKKGVWGKWRQSDMLLCVPCHQDTNTKINSLYISFRANEDMKKTIESACEKMGLNKSEFIRAAISDSIKGFKRKGIL